jgi:hypothetical protein
LIDSLIVSEKHFQNNESGKSTTIRRSRSRKIIICNISKKGLFYSFIFLLYLFIIHLYQLDNNDEDQSSITPKRPLLSRDRGAGTFIDVSPLSDRNSRPEQRIRTPLPASPLATVKNDQSPISVVENCMFVISPPQPNRSTVIDDDDNSYVPAYINRKAHPAPSTTWKISFPMHKLSSTLKTSIETPPDIRPG